MARIYIANLWFEKCYFSHLRFTLFNFCNPPLLKTMANLANNWWSSMAETYPKREREGISITLHAWLIFNSPKALSCSLSFSNQACNFSFRLYFHVVVFCLFVFFFFLVVWWPVWRWTRGRRWLWKAPFLRDCIDNWKFHVYCNCSFIFAKKFKLHPFNLFYALFSYKKVFF